MRDPAFGPDAPERLEGALPHARVVRLEDIGDFLPEEAPSAVKGEVSDVLVRR